MGELRPVEEVAMDVGRGLYGRPYDETVGIIQADREEVVEACVEAGVDRMCYLLSLSKNDPYMVSLHDTILAVAKPVESRRERLGRVLFESNPYNGYWERMDDNIKKEFCDRAEAVVAELRRIEEEDDG